MKRFLTNFKNVIVPVLCFVIVVALSIFITACASSDNTSSTPNSTNSDNVQASSNVSDDGIGFSDFKILSANEKGNKIEVDTTLCKISYSSAFSDAISVKAEGTIEYAKLNFYANLSSGETMIYSIIFGGEEATPFGTLRINDAEETINVQVAFFEAPDALDKDDKATFNATQETFNDVVSSFKENDRFSEIG